MSAGLFFVRARHERQRVAAAGRRRDAAVVSALPSRVRSRCGVARSGRRIEAAARTGLRANGVGIRHLAFGSRVFGGARPTVVYPAKPSRAGSPRCGPAFQSRRETAADAEAKRNRSVVSAPSGPHRHPSGMHVEPLGTRSTAETAPRLRSRRRFDRAGRASPRSPRSPANASAEIRHARTAASAPHPAKNGKCPATKIRQSKGRTMRAAARTRSAQRRAARRAMRRRANAG